MNLVLASASERRKELLSRITKDFNIVISNFNESLVDFNGDCGKYVMDLAEGKGRFVAETLNYPAFVIGCDTVVVYKGKILGKPKDEKEAFETLKELSGNVHEVYSGLVVIDTKEKKIKRDYACTSVKFSQLTDTEIKNYIATGEPMDKAGAYGIQGFGGVFVEYITGDYYSVVGLPLNKLKYMLRDMGVNL